ncbi:uncharacterized protein LOC120143623 [Hibiscus syriacus]|uniref:uncharacterized protein LOC120143623 n=1 Tax=Hibiscus syriacus TaxID=106335 RepID=UPI0019232441|nr:uncharacterized protein LOC120143623 [Hibiscus syriacus]
MDRLPTKDRLARFGIQVDHICGLCGVELESRNHLILECSFAREVWDVILQTCGLHNQPILCWDDSLHWLALNLRGKSLLVCILKLAWTGFVYFLWEERKHRLFRGVNRSVDTIVHKIRDSIRIKLYRCSMNLIDDVNRRLCLDWDLSWCYIVLCSSLLFLLDE